MKKFSLFSFYKNSLKAKLIVNVIFIHIALIFFIMLDLLLRENHFLYERISEKGFNSSALLVSNAATPLLHNDLVALDELLNQILINDVYLIFIMDRYGKVRASNDKKYFNLYLQDEKSKELLQAVRTSQQDTIQVEHNNLIDTISCITIDDNIVGFVRVVLDKKQIDSQIKQTINNGLIYMLIAIIFGSLFAWIGIRKFTKKLDSVSLAAKQIANKDFSISLPQTTSDDELDNMINALDVMSNSISGYISQLNSTNELIYDEKEFAEVTLSSIADGVIVTDINGIVNFINPAAQKIIKCTIFEAKGKKIESIFTLLHEDTLMPIIHPVYDSISEDEEILLNNKAILINNKHEHFAIEDSTAPIRDIKGKIRGAVFVFRDITTKKADEKKVRWQATHDELTKLNNRIGFQHTLEELFENRTPKTHHVLLFMDLDKFKVVNDTAGHLAGDEVLKDIATLLQEKTRKNDFLCRFGGDEFGLILKDCDINTAKNIAKKLIDSVLEYSFFWEGKKFKIGLSIGIAPIDSTSISPTTVLSNADSACYRAKDLGRNRYHIYNPDEIDSNANIKEMDWIARINQGLKNKNFVLHVQKIQGLSSDTVHYEVLIRLIENGTIYYPDSFLSHARIYALMPQIDRYVIRELFEWYSTHKEHLNNQVFSINLSGQSISDKELASDIIALSEHYKIDNRNFIFEVTESSTIENLNLSMLFFSALQAKGFAFSLDDFGTGLSSFAYLKTLPVNYLKIDGVFIKDILTNEIDRGIVTSIHNISALMDIKTVAEYVESIEAQDTLKSIGIDYAQGYAIEKPHDINNLLK